MAVLTPLIRAIGPFTGLIPAIGSAIHSMTGGISANLSGIMLSAGLLAIPQAVHAASEPDARAPASGQTSRTNRTAHAAPAIERWRPYIAEASTRFGIPQAWIAAVMQAESAGQTHLNGHPIRSSAGAMGLMQLMPKTWAAMRRAHGLGANPDDPRDNILAGAAYLRAMHDRYGYPGLFAAYNAGPGRYEQHLRTGQRLPAETRAYIAQLAHAPQSPDLPPAILSGTRLFFSLGNGPQPGRYDAPAATSGSNDRTAIEPDVGPEAPTSVIDIPAENTGKPPITTPPSGGLFIPRTPVPGGQS